MTPAAPVLVPPWPASIMTTKRAGLVGAGVARPPRPSTAARATSHFMSSSSDPAPPGAINLLKYQHLRPTTDLRGVRGRIAELDLFAILLLVVMMEVVLNRLAVSVLRPAVGKPLPDWHKHLDHF